MQTRDVPPSRKSILATGDVKPFGPHQRFTCSGSLQAFHTLSTGASKMRVTTRSFFLTCDDSCSTLASPKFRTIRTTWSFWGAADSPGSAKGPETIARPANQNIITSVLIPVFVVCEVLLITVSCVLIILHLW